MKQLKTLPYMYLWLETRHLAEFNWKFLVCTKFTIYKQSCPIYSPVISFYRPLGLQLHHQEQKLTK